jgi:hypothetical protein
VGQQQGTVLQPSDQELQWQHMWTLHTGPVVHDSLHGLWHWAVLIGLAHLCVPVPVPRQLQQLQLPPCGPLSP